MQKRGKKAAFELSVTTMIVIVLAITMLILGLILIKNIFTAATESVDELNDKVSNEIDKIFTDEDKKIVEHQEMNRYGAVCVATLTGATVTMVENIQGKVEEASDKLIKLIKGD